MIGELINLSTLLLGLATKVPQIYDICKAGKADGIAPTGVAMEIWGFATFIMYTVGSEFPKWMYYEAAIILSQNTILLFLVLHYQRSLNARSIGIYMACALFQVGIALKYFPSFIITFVMNGNLLLMVIAMSTQLRMIIRNKDAGSLSLVSYIIAVYIMSVRLRFIFGSGDPNLMLGFGIAYLFNIAIMLSVWYYKKPKPEKSKDL